MANRLLMYLTIFCLCSAVTYAHNTFTGGYSGSPGASSCASSCHGTTAGTLTVTGFPQSYVPGQTYRVVVAHNGGSKIVNFNLTTRIGSSSSVAGTFAPINNSTLFTGADGGVYANPHAIDSAAFSWTAPSQGTGAVNLYASGFQGGTTSSSGDSHALTISASELATLLPPPAPALVSPANAAMNVAVQTSLNWSASSGATSYALQVASNSSFTTIVSN